MPPSPEEDVIMTILTDRETWKVDNQEVRMSKGKLIKVELRPGQFVKMYEADAIAQGLTKAKPQAQNKMIEPEATKAEGQAEDLTTIPGIGPATVRALAAHGIINFEQLRAAGQIGYLSEKVNLAIEEWRNA